MGIGYLPHIAPPPPHIIPPPPLIGPGPLTEPEPRGVRRRLGVEPEPGVGFVPLGGSKLRVEPEPYVGVELGP